MNEAGYQTLIVKFSEPITVLDGMFDDAEPLRRKRPFTSAVLQEYRAFC